METKNEYVEICAVEMNVGINWMVQTPTYEAHEGDLIEVPSEGRILTGKVIAVMRCMTESEEYRLAEAIAGKTGIRRAKALLRRRELVFEDDDQSLS